MSLLLLYYTTTPGGVVGADYVPPVSTYGYTQPKDVVIRVQALDGTWETCGADRARGIVPENVQLSSDQWGSKTASFQLRRNPRVVWPDIGAFAPVEVEVGGRIVWSGRVNETPVRDSTDSVITVQCVGWQAHLDDDLYERIYVHTNLTEYRDARSALNATLGRVGTAAGMVQAENGVLAIGWPKGAQLGAASGCYAAATLDLGPQSTAKRVVFTYEKPTATASSGYFTFICRASDSADFVSSSSEDISSTDISALASSGTVAATITTPKRFLHFGLSFTNAANVTLGEDNIVKITSAQVFADTAYESGNASVLKSDAVIKDALNTATILFDADRTGIETGTFNIPEFAPSEPRTPREIWTAVDAFEDRYKKIDVMRRPIYKAQPTSPQVEVGAWSGMEFEDSSSNSGEDIYSRVIITGSQPNGLPLRVFRTQSQQEGSAAPKVQTIAGSPGGDMGIYSGGTSIFDNPSFDTDTTSWTKSGSTITRDTSTYDSSPASGRWDGTGASDPLPLGSSLTTTLTGNFKAGTTYRAVFAVRAGTFTGTAPASFSVRFGSSTDYGKANLYFTAASALFTQVSIDWTPQATVTSGVKLTLVSAGNTVNGAAATYLWLDTASVQIATTTLVERRGFLRTKQVATSFMLTEGAAQQIADKWLLSHRSSAFKGRAKLTGNAAVRDIISGRAVPAEELLLRTGELMRFGDRVDPDTGAIGRDGRIVEVQYDVDSDAVDVTIDSSRAGFEALLERLGVVLGQNRSL